MQIVGLDMLFGLFEGWPVHNVIPDATPYLPAGHTANNASSG